MASSSSGLKLLTKLSRDHIELTSFSRMRVDLAAQVLLLHCLLKLVTVVQCATQALSESVANGLNY